jgi:hypothetical protein
MHSSGVTTAIEQPGFARALAAHCSSFSLIR